MNTPQTAPRKFKVTFSKAWTSMFGYSALSEEEDEEEADKLERRNENTTEIRNGKLRRFTWGSCTRGLISQNICIQETKP